MQNREKIAMRQANILTRLMQCIQCVQYIKHIAITKQWVSNGKRPDHKVQLRTIDGTWYMVFINAFFRMCQYLYSLFCIWVSGMDENAWIESDTECSHSLVTLRLILNKMKLNFLTKHSHFVFPDAIQDSGICCIGNMKFFRFQHGIFIWIK